MSCYLIIVCASSSAAIPPELEEERESKYEANLNQIRDYEGNSVKDQLPEVALELLHTDIVVALSQIVSNTYTVATCVCSFSHAWQANLGAHY